MLSKGMIEKLNEQISMERYSSSLYLQMSAWAEINGMPGSATFLRAQASEELEHMHRLFKYVYETGGLPVLGEIKAPPTEYDSISAMFKQVFDHEKTITDKINKLMDSAQAEKDHSTVNFLRWYVAEQHEEEHTMQQILDQIDHIGESESALYFIDRAIGGMLHRK